MICHYGARAWKTVKNVQYVQRFNLILQIYNFAQQFHHSDFSSEILHMISHFIVFSGIIVYLFIYCLFIVYCGWSMLNCILLPCPIVFLIVVGPHEGTSRRVNIIIYYCLWHISVCWSVIILSAVLVDC